MKKFKDSVKIKVFLGYITLVVLASLVVWVIYAEILQNPENKVDLSPSTNKFIAINAILTNLYQAEGLERSYSQSGQNALYQDYLNLMNTIRLQIDTLASMLNDTRQRLHTDSIKVLLDVKQKNLKELYSIKRANTSTARYKEGLKKIPMVKDTIDHFSNVYREVITNHDSVYVKQKKKKFFGRLADVFSSRKKVDSTLQVVTSKSIKIDSILEKTHPADSIAGFITSIMTELRDEGVALETRLKQKEKEILINDQTISMQLRQMLSAIEREELYSSFQKVEEQQARVEKATRLILFVGGFALIAIVFFLVNILRDISKSQHYRQNLEVAKAYSESLLKSKEQFMLSLTHDLKSPLNSIIGFTGFMEDGEEKLTQRQQKYLQNINRASRHILKLINDLLDLARLETGKLTIERIPFKLSHLIEDIVEGFKPQAQKNSIDLQLEMNVLSTAVFMGDPVRITQILGNLISNAIKFTSDGTVTVRVSETRTTNKAEWIQLDVIDTGIGISDENRQRIFEEFARVSTDNKQYEGTGLGLTITQKLVNLLSGTIRLESKPGEGSHFIVTIPLEPATELSPDFEEARKKVGLNISPNLAGKRIWLIDDDQTLLEMTSMILQKAGAEVRSFSDPLKAISSFRKDGADILITDFQMPKMNGEEVLQKIQEINEGPISAIAISGSDELINKVTGFTAFISKPFEAQTLIDILSGQQNAKVESNRTDPSGNGHPSGYNLDQFKAFAAGDPESLRQILVSFVSTGNQNARLFRQSIQEENRYAVSELSHKMLPLFRQLQATDIAELLAQLERKELENMDYQNYFTMGKQALVKIEEILQTIQEEEHIVLS